MCLKIFIAAMLALWQDTGTIRVKADVVGVKVLLDGNEVGESPLTLGPLSAGKHQVMLVKGGFEDHREEVEVKPGMEVRMFVVMKRTEVKLPELPFTLRVVHQHRIGACIGMLTVSLDALYYKAENDTDEFHMPFSRTNSVSRSMGSFPTTIYSSALPNIATNMLPMRLELRGRSFGFLAIAGDQSKAPLNEVLWNKEVGEETTKLFQIVFELWMRSLKVPKK
jgi:hypothetical protein